MIGYDFELGLSLDAAPATLEMLGYLTSSSKKVCGTLWSSFSILILTMLIIHFLILCTEV